MQLDCLTFYQDWLKRLNPESVQCRCTVEHDRMLFDHFLKHIPHRLIELLHQLLRVFDILGDLP